MNDSAAPACVQPAFVIEARDYGQRAIRRRRRFLSNVAFHHTRATQPKLAALVRPSTLTPAFRLNDSKLKTRQQSAAARRMSRVVGGQLKRREVRERDHLEWLCASAGILGYQSVCAPACNVNAAAGRQLTH